MRALTGATFAALAVLASAGCSKHDSTAGAQTPDDAAGDRKIPPVPGDQRLEPASRVQTTPESLAEARCDQQARCENIGSEKKYVTHQDCVSRVGNDWMGDLRARDCPAGTDPDALSSCVGEIRSQDCADTSTLASFESCGVARLCQPAK